MEYLGQEPFSASDDDHFLVSDAPSNPAAHTLAHGAAASNLDRCPTRGAQAEITICAGRPAPFEWPHRRKRTFEVLGIDPGDRCEGTEFGAGTAPPGLAGGCSKEKWRDCFDPIFAALCQLQATMQTESPKCLDDFKFVARKLAHNRQQLDKIVLSQPCYGMVAASTALESIKSELIDRSNDTYSRAPRLFEWLVTLQDPILEFDGLDGDVQVEPLEDVGLELEMHSSIVEYCVEAVQEVFEEERENQQCMEDALERVMQHRLAQSVASRS